MNPDHVRSSLREFYEAIPILPLMGPTYEFYEASPIPPCIILGQISLQRKLGHNQTCSCVEYMITLDFFHKHTHTQQKRKRKEKNQPCILLVINLMVGSVSTGVNLAHN